MPHLWPTSSSSGWPPSITARYFSSCPSDSTSRWTPCPPGPTSGGFRSALLCFRLSPSCPFRPLHTFHSSRPARNYPRFWIRRSSSERQRDLNPPDQHAAQRTLWASPTPGPVLTHGYVFPPAVSRVSTPAPPGLPVPSTNLSLRAVPIHPGKPCGVLLPLLSPPVAGFTLLWQAGRLSSASRGRIGFTFVTARRFASRGSVKRIASLHARSATC